MSSKESPRWAARSVDLCWSSWDADEHVLYDVASGDTHLLNGIAAAAVRHLGQEPLSGEELVERLCCTHGVEPTLEFTREIERLLDRLDQLGLVERVP